MWPDPVHNQARACHIASHTISEGPMHGASGLGVWAKGVCSDRHIRRSTGGLSFAAEAAEIHRWRAVTFVIAIGLGDGAVGFLVARNVVLQCIEQALSVLRRYNDAALNTGLLYARYHANEVEDKLLGRVGNHNKVRVRTFGFLGGELDVQLRVAVGIGVECSHMNREEVRRRIGESGGAVSVRLGERTNEIAFGDHDVGAFCSVMLYKYSAGTAFKITRQVLQMQ